jgi:HAUS augmin-like complex subunit 2
MIDTSCFVCDNHEQRQFSELLLKAAGDYGALTASTTDIHWTQNFKEPPSVWGVLTLLPLAQIEFI